MQLTKQELIIMLKFIADKTRDFQYKKIVMDIEELSELNELKMKLRNEFVKVGIEDEK